jgi:hypothetical protein
MFALFALALPSWSCQRGPATLLVTPPEYAPAGQSKCDIIASPTRPLVVEWPSADRASLEARLASGLVAVRAAGCEIEVLRQCVVPGSYLYRALTRKNDQVLITDVDDLYVQMPLGAARLASKLARSGKLDVRMALVGMLEAPTGRIAADTLSGDCDGATHVIAGVQLGAFQFFAGGSGEMGAGLVVGVAGLGGRSEASRELLSADGDPTRCDGSASIDLRPPEGCGAVIRIELTPLKAAPPPVVAASCPSGSTMNDGRCVISQTYCPDGTQPLDGRCMTMHRAWTEPPPRVEPPPPAPAASPAVAPTPTAGRAYGGGPSSVEEDPQPALCRDLCEQMLTCTAKWQGWTSPANELVTQQLQLCGKKCDTTPLTADELAKLDRCLGRGCDVLEQCMPSRNRR